MRLLLIRLLSCFICGVFIVQAELLEAQLLRVGRELRGESIIAPGTKTYVLSNDGMFPYEAVEIRVSYLSLPPASFTFEVTSFPDDGSVSIKKTRTKRPNLLRRRRRRLDTAITTVATGRSGAILLDGVENTITLLVVTVTPTGVQPGIGIEKEVEIRYNIIMERKIINNALPETAMRMIGFGIFCLFFSAICLVPMLSKSLGHGDELISKQKE